MALSWLRALVYRSLGCRPFFGDSIVTPEVKSPVVDVRVPTFVASLLDFLGASIGTLVVLKVDPLGDSIVTLEVPGFDPFW
jgi:hypothetical protein